MGPSSACATQQCARRWRLYLRAGLSLRKGTQTSGRIARRTGNSSIMMRMLRLTDGGLMAGVIRLRRWRSLERRLERACDRKHAAPTHPHCFFMTFCACFAELECRASAANTVITRGMIFRFGSTNNYHTVTPLLYSYQPS